MGEAVSYRIVAESPITINANSVGIGGHNWVLTRTYLNCGIRHFVGKNLFGDTIDFILRGRNALICEH